MQRRNFLKLSVGTAAAAAFATRATAQAGVKEIRIGYQKTGVLVITRQQASLEKHFTPQGIEVKWVEFSSGPPMMEAVNVGSIDYGAVGDSPPVFAQAAGAAIVYAAGQPITNGQGILVPKDSPIHAIADLKGKRVGFTKGSSAHNVVVQTLEKAGLTYSDITPVYLTPPDAGPAFANGSIDAWAIWDPYFAIGETKQNGRILINAREVTKTNTSTADTFRTPDLGMLGYMQDNKPHFYRESTRSNTADTEFDLSGLDSLPQVEIVYAYGNYNSIALDAFVKAGAKGIVHAGPGDGSVGAQMVKPLQDARAAGVAVVRSARVGSGIIARNGEQPDDKYDWVVSDDLNPQKARILLMLALTKTSDTKKIQEDRKSVV